MHLAIALFQRIPQFFFTWSFFFGAGMLVYLRTMLSRREGFSIRELIRDCLPFNPIRSKSFHIDVVTYVVTKLTLFIWTVPGIAIYAAVSEGLSHWLDQTGGAIPDASAGPVATLLCTLVIFVFAEFAYFIVHFTNHKVSFLWELHKVHHSAEVLNPLTNTRAHPVSQTYKFIVIGFISALPSGIIIHYFGFSVAELILLTAIADKLASVCTLDALRHSHFPISFGALDRVFISPHMHHIHHSSLQQHHDTNYGLNLSIFDWMFGTAYKPQADERGVSGIFGYSEEEMRQSQTLGGAYYTPLKKIAQGATRRRIEDRSQEFPIDPGEGPQFGN